MEIFISDDITDFKSNLIQILVHYLEIEERKLGRLITLDKKKQKMLKIENLPLVINTSTDYPFEENELTEIHSDEISICKEIAKVGLLYGFLFGKNKQEEESVDKFLLHLNQDLNLDPQKIIVELNKNLLFSTFIDDSERLTFKDLYAYTILAPFLNKASEDTIEEFNNVARWADYIQNQENILRALNIIKAWFQIPIVKFSLEEEPKKKKKKEKKVLTKEEIEFINKKKQEKQKSKEQNNPGDEECYAEKAEKENNKEGKKGKKGKNKG